VDPSKTITARLYTGTRNNLQFLSSENWVGLDRNYQGMGLQYNAQTTLGAIPLKWVAGYEYDRSSERRQGGSAPDGEKSGNLSRNEVNTASNSDVFLQGTALVSERWSLIGGMRHSTVRFKSSDDFVTQNNPDGSGTARYSATNPVLGVTWHAADAVNVYANWGKGFETPTLAEVAYRATDVLVAEFNPDLGASSSRHFEVGTKWTPTPQSRVDLALFRVNTTDEIVVSKSANGQSAFKNAPGTRRTGMELSARTLLGDQWQASLSASTIKATFSQSFFTTNPNAPVRAGNRLTGIPQHFVFGELQWAASGFADKSRSPRLGVQGGIELIDAGKLYANDTNTAAAAGYSIVNLKASHAWRLGQGTLTAYARLDNATDRSYTGSVIVNQASLKSYEPAPGRNWTAGLRLSLPL
jgi:iron complex outermembrane receptor protein